MGLIERIKEAKEEIKEKVSKHQEIFKTLKECGFKHQGYTKNFETMQPRYSFRIDLKQDLEDIEEQFSKTTKQRIAKSLKDIFRIRYRTDGLDVVLAYAKENAVIRTKEEYKLVSDYVLMREYIKNNRWV